MINNLRDLGGIVNCHGEVIPFRMFYRSANLSDATLDDLAGISEVIDLRTATGRERAPDQIPENIIMLSRFLTRRPPELLGMRRWTVFRIWPAFTGKWLYPVSQPYSQFSLLFFHMTILQEGFCGTAQQGRTAAA